MLHGFTEFIPTTTASLIDSEWGIPSESKNLAIRHCCDWGL